MDAVTLTGKTVVVTGANTGIGKETARELARRGARVVLACRSADRGEQARREIVASTDNEDVVVRILDLSSLQSVRKFAEQFNREESRLDILVNNAGVFTRERRETSDGFEMQFGTNHLGHFYLTYLLVPKLRASAPSRLVVVASEAHEHGKIDLDDLQLTRSYGALSAYGKSKTANVLFATHIAKLLEGSGVTVYSLHPGVIKTELVREYEGNCLVGCFNCFYSCCCGGYLTPEQGAQTTLYCCLEPSLASQSGRYYSEMKEKKAKSYATNPDSAERLWRISADLCKVSPALPTE